MENPLLKMSGLPQFSLIKAKHIEPAVKQVITESQKQIKNLLENKAPWQWHTLIEPLEKISANIERMWSPVSQLNAVQNNSELRQAYNTGIKILSDFHTELSQNEALYKAIKQFSKSQEYNQLDWEQKKVISNKLRDFQLAGVALAEDQKKTFKNLRRDLTELKTKFTNQVLDASQAWTLLVTDIKELAGIPSSNLQLMAENAKKNQMQGWLLNLDLPCYLSIMQYAQNSDLRQKIYHAFTTRASDQGPKAKQWDNGPVIDEILLKRHKIAKLLDFNNYSEYSLATKMAESPKQVFDFLNNLAEHILPLAKQELLELEEFAKEQGKSEPLAVWDFAYYSELLKQTKYNINQEELRVYFPIDKVLSGLFTIISKLFGYIVVEQNDFDSWHEDVRFFAIKDNKNTLIGQFYLDLYARDNKRQGAWMAGARTRTYLNDKLQRPLVFINCNFRPALNGQPALLSHQEILTLFHEFGHGLHHLLSEVNYPSISGINGVAWDAIELPSQLMENWCWQEQCIALISAHYQTQQALPEQQLDMLLKAKNHNSALFSLRQIEFALFDFQLHSDPNLIGQQKIQGLLDSIRSKLSLIKYPEYNRMQHSFSHIFANSYAAGYYSYKWAEVLSADAFSLFEENGIFDQTTGRKLLNTILKKGGSADAMDLFKQFRGREATVDALLRHNGLSV